MCRKSTPASGAPFKRWPSKDKLPDGDRRNFVIAIRQGDGPGILTALLSLRVATCRKARGRLARPPRCVGIAGTREFGLQSLGTSEAKGHPLIKSYLTAGT